MDRLYRRTHCFPRKQKEQAFPPLSTIKKSGNQVTADDECDVRIRYLHIVFQKEFTFGSFVGERSPARHVVSYFVHLDVWMKRNPMELNWFLRTLLHSVVQCSWPHLHVLSCKPKYFWLLSNLVTATYPLRAEPIISMPWCVWWHYYSDVVRIY